MKNNYVYIINSTSGVGKSTLLKNLHTQLPDSFAIIDGDDVGRVVPYNNNINWLNLIQDNISDCCSNYKKYGYNNCIVSFVLPVKERLERLSNMLKRNDFCTKHIILECSEDEIERRLKERNTSKILNIEQAKNISREIKNLSADFRVDNPNIMPDEIAELILNYIMEINNEID